MLILQILSGNGKGTTVTFGSIYIGLGSPVFGFTSNIHVPSADAGENKPLGSACAIVATP